jgi:hypothetical protein
MDLNNADSCVSVLTLLLSGEYPTTERLLQIVLVITSWHRPHRKRNFQQFLYCCAWTGCHGNLCVSQALRGNRCTRYSIASISEAVAVTLYAVYLLCNYNQCIQLRFSNLNWVVMLVTCLGKIRSTSNILVCNFEENGPLVITVCRWEDNIKTDLK